MALASAIESRSEHPVGKVFTKAADKPDNLVINSVKAIPGKGVEAILNDVNYRLGNIAFVAGMAGELEGFQPSENVTTVALCREDEWLAVFELEDKLRPQAADVVAQLQRLGLQVELLSGDAREAVALVADKLGINDFHFSQSPEDKLRHIRQLQSRGAVVAMIGDGVNDAPVLSGADVSFAMGSGTQLAHASADMVLLSEQLDHLLSGLRMARRTLAIIKQNLGWAVLYNVIAIPLAATGMVAPWMAALGMSSSSLVVVINALRLRRNS
jgi:Cu2+-exporting ATPase